VKRLKHQVQRRRELIILNIINLSQENEVLVFLLPSLPYQGSFYIPFPSAPYLTLKWGEEYFIRTKMVRNEDVKCSPKTGQGNKVRNGLP